MLALQPRTNPGADEAASKLADQRQQAAALQSGQSAKAARALTNYGIPVTYQLVEGGEPFATPWWANLLLLVPVVAFVNWRRRGLALKEKHSADYGNYWAAGSRRSLITFANRRR